MTDGDPDMPDTQDDVIRTIPHLRRYARILTGSREAGDSWVEQCLHRFMETPGDVDAEAGGRLKLRLFRILHEVGADLADEAEGESEAAGFKNRFRQSLKRLPPTDRQLLLLVVTEGFSLEDAGAVLGLDRAKAVAALDSARRRLRDATSVPILIIEDEPLIAMDLAQTVEEMGYTVSGTANREAKAVSAAEAAPPALILADIQLLDGDSGIRAVDRILQRFDVPVVFVTGYPERLLAGQTREPTYIVTKPFDTESLKVTIEQALGHHAGTPERTLH